jgi:beta-N-acetylhexosaminidase
VNPYRHLMLAFEGASVPAWLEEVLAATPMAGVTLFRELNLESPSQTAELVERLQAMNTADVDLLVAIDQEGGQLQGLVGSTPFAGNMALGAADDIDLTRRVARAMGHELASVGINLNYAPVADIASRPRNPSLGVRSFGEDPARVGAHVAAAVEGFRSGGVLCTLKHFPGKGEAVVDPHFELPRMDLDLVRLEAVELVPFASGIAAGANLLMTGHYGVPALTGFDETPVSMSEPAIDGFIRSEMGFEGVVITDALDMGALDQGAGQVVDIIASLRGGTDLLLVMPDEGLRERARLAVERGAARGLIPTESLQASARRVDALRRRLPATAPDPAVVGSHFDLAGELARSAVTLVRDDADNLPLRLDAASRVLVLEPEPTNVTPADTTALYPTSLAEAVRNNHGQVSQVIFPHEPTASDIAGLLTRSEEADLVVVGTVNATQGQADLVMALAHLERPLVTIAMREPQDLPTYPAVATHICTYSSHGPSLAAAVDAMFGLIGFPGRLPVALPGLYPIGHGATK